MDPTNAVDEKVGGRSVVKLKKNDFHFNDVLCNTNNNKKRNAHNIHVMS